MRWTAALAGSITLLMLSLFPVRRSDAQTAPVYSRNAAFRIPFRVAPTADSRAMPFEVRLLQSTDGGRRWITAERQRPTATSFAYRARFDGEHWFCVRTVDRNGKLHPDTPPSPELKVIVDTQAPRLLLSTQARSGADIALTFRATDAALATDSLTLEVTAGDSNSWKPIKIPHDAQTTAVDGQIIFTGTTILQISDSKPLLRVRARIVDRAGNPTVAHRDVKMPNVAITAGTPDAPSRPNIPGVVHNPYVRGANSSAGTARDTANDSARTNDPPVRWPANRVVDRSPIRSPSTGFMGNTTDALSDEGAPPEITALVPRRSQHAPPVGPASPEASPGVGRLASSSGGQTPLHATTAPPDEPAQTQMTRLRRFHMDYDVEEVGPSGVSKVELWMTRDGGKTWMNVGMDLDGKSPFLVEPPGEGVFGYRIVAQGGNGLTGNEPKSAKDAQMWVAVDWTRPQVEITSAQYGKGDRAGQLEIRWRAADAKLSDTPISLFYRGATTDPWLPIETNVTNTGVYFWRVDGQIPRSIYLRIEAQDAAGNVAEHEIDHPIANDGLVPHGRIRGIRPPTPPQTGRRPSPPTRWQ
jgi:hypothetical protein